MSKFHLSLDPDPSANGDGSRERTEPPETARDKAPVLGWFAVGFGVLAVFSWSIIFVPLALICGIVALFVGQVFWGIGAIVLAVIAIVTSPIWLMTLGLGAMATFMHMGAPAM